MNNNGLVACALRLQLAPLSSSRRWNFVHPCSRNYDYKSSSRKIRRSDHRGNKWRRWAF